jgi:hypothetical protein
MRCSANKESCSQKKANKKTLFQKTLFFENNIFVFIFNERNMIGLLCHFRNNFSR